jgi:2-iminoacetate synthase ThiH
MEKAIREAGREPMQRDTFYRRIESTLPQRKDSIANIPEVSEV